MVGTDASAVGKIGMRYASKVFIVEGYCGMAAEKDRSFIFCIVASVYSYTFEFRL